MFWRKILFLAAGYVAWNMIASVYSEKKKKKNWAHVKGFFQTQQNLIEDLENKYLSKEGKKSINNVKKNLVNGIQHAEKMLHNVLADERVKEGISKVQDVADSTYKQGKDYIATTYAEVKALEKQKKDQDDSWSKKKKDSK